MPTRVAADAPKVSAIAIRCGIAVIGTRVPRGMPTTVPTPSPNAIQR
jgi:hypothetical protein